MEKKYKKHFCKGEKVFAPICEECNIENSLLYELINSEKK